MDDKLLDLSVINRFAEEVYETNKRNGFHEDDRAFSSEIALCHSELSEALEADRGFKYLAPGSDLAQECIDNLVTSGDITQFRKEFQENIKDTREDELADTVIRIFDMCRKYRIDIASHLQAKVLYNATREYRHGGKAY